MSIIKIESAYLAFGLHPLLDHARFQADAGERIALIGRNGTGKSSLLKIMAGVLTLDDGEVVRKSHLNIGYVPQEPQFAEDDTVFSAVVSDMGEVSNLLSEYHHLSTELANHTKMEDGGEATLNRLSHLQSQLETKQAWSYQSIAEQIISTFNLSSSAKVTDLSGGQRKRLAIARSLAYTPDLLLLDEPTNHLDVSAIMWLENLLKQVQFANTACIFITHDRSFLGNVATRIVELDRGKLQSFPGNYATYLERKALILNEEIQQNARHDKLLKAEEQWIRQGVEARRTRSVYRVAQLERLRKERTRRRECLGRANINLDRGEKSGELVAELKSVYYSYPIAEQEKTHEKNWIVQNFSTRIMAGDKIGLIGRNGAGKTTLLRLILGELEPSNGSVRLGTRINVAYFDQFRSQLDENSRLIDVINSSSDFVEVNGKRRHILGYLEDFLFPPERARSPVSSLSGGERNRLLLAKLFSRHANVLVLDEPTNDLDIETLELLEQLISEYSGTVFLVSHDRQFLDNIVTQSIVYEGLIKGQGGYWHEYVGGFSDWRAQSKAPLEKCFALTNPSDDVVNNENTNTISPAKVTSSNVNVPISNTRKVIKLSWKENQELSDIPKKIAKLEAEQKTLSTRLEDPSLYIANPNEANTIAKRLKEIDDDLMSILENWEYLEEKKRLAGK